MKSTRKSLVCLTKFFQDALGEKQLPGVFTRAVMTMVGRGFHPNVFRNAKPLRKILISPKMQELQDVQGVYFGRLESTWEDDPTDWESYGWDGIGRFMMFPSENIPTWVVLHEFGHYLDEVFFSQRTGHFFGYGYDVKKVTKFHDLHHEMRYEFRRVQREAKDSLLTDELAKRHWYRCVNWEIANKAPTRYSLLTFGEWTAEAFRCYYLEPEAIKDHCPATYKFLKFALSGEMFKREPRPKRRSALAAAAGHFTTFSFEGGVWDWHPVL